MSFVGPAAIQLQASATSSDSTIKSVTYSWNGKTLATETVSPYIFNWKNVVAGSYAITAVAKDALGIASAQSAPVNITVTQDQAAAVTLSVVPASGFTSIGPETLDLEASVTTGDEPVVSVAFYADGKKVSTSKTGPNYAFALTKVAAGLHSFYAVATDSLGTPGQSATVTFTALTDSPPSVAILAPASGSSAVTLTTVDLVASATSTDEPIKSVVFNQVLNGQVTKVGTAAFVASLNAYQYAWKKVPVGSYTLEAVATDSLGIPGTSATISLTVNPDLSPTVAIVTPTSGANYASPASIGLSAAASSPDVSVASVTYYQGGTNKLSTVTAAPYLYTWKPASAGSYSITAVATDSVGTVSAPSAPVTVNVVSTTSTVKITKPANGTTVGTPGTVALTATATAAAGVANVGFFAGGALLGTATASPYQFTWNAAPEGVYDLTAVATDRNGGSITSAPISIRLDTPPSVQMTTPTNGSVFIAPAAIDIAAIAAASGTGKITKVEFFLNSAPIGTSTTSPYSVQTLALPAGTYSLTVEAFDSYGIASLSPSVSVQVVTEQPPAISLSTATSGLTFGSSSNVSLAFSATATTSIARIEIYRNGALVATLTSPLSGSTWAFTESGTLPVGQYTYYARAYDTTGASTDSANVTVIVAPNLPYITDFESPDFAQGALGGQEGWNVPQSIANVSATAYSGSQGVQLAAGSPAAIAQQVFGSSPGETIIHCDFYAMPTAEASIGNSTVFTAEQSQFGFQLANGVGVLQVFRGNGTGGGTWVPTSYSIPLNSSNQAQSWVRLTARLDFTRNTWDIYANGNMVAYDIPFTNNAGAYFSTFTAQGAVAADSFFDTLYIGPVNPLFTDANNDGIDDEWENQYGLSLTASDRYLNLSGDGVPIIQDYADGSSPLINTRVTPPPVQSGIVLDLRADAGVVLDTNGNVREWLDQGPQGNIAAPNTPTGPQFAMGQINGLPVISFNGTESLSLPYNLMQNASSGEVIGVVKVGSNPGQFNMLWNFGTYLGSSYLGDAHFDDFGSSDFSSVSESPSEIAQYFIYDTSIDSSGTTIYRYDGFPEWTRNGLTVGFGLYPDIGGYGTGMLIGNIAEVIVYDRTLTDSERSAMGTYLLSKYAFPSITAPAGPTDLLATAVSSDEVDLSWTLMRPPTHEMTTIMRQSGSGGFVQIAQVGDSMGYTDTGLTPGVTYTYQIEIQGFAGSSGPSNSSTATTPANIADLPQDGLSLWLRSTVGTEGAGPLSIWADQSGLGNDAVPVEAASPPQVVDNQANGLPVVRFSGAEALNLPQNMLQAAQAGHIIAVVKIPNIPNESNTLWNFGSGNGTSYNSFGGSAHYDDFGSSDTSVVQEDPNEISQYYVYDASIDSSGNYTYRFDGVSEWTRTVQTVGFPQDTDIGGYGGGSLVGDIAEIVIYDRVLSPSEQTTVYAYLAFKYGLPSIVANLNPMSGPSIPVIDVRDGVSGQEGISFAYQILASNHPSGYTAAGLPDGLTLNPSTGIISGTPTIWTEGAYFVDITATNAAGSGSATLLLEINPGLPVFAATLTATGQENVPFSYQITASEDPTSFAAAGLPPWLNFNPNGTLSGTPPTGAAGAYAVNLTGTNATGSSFATLTITIASGAALPLISSALTAAGSAGLPFNYQILASSSPTGYSAAGLPAWMEINTGTGLISGIPAQSQAGTYQITVSASNSAGLASAQVAITILGAGANPNIPGIILQLEGDTGIQVQTINGVSTAVWTDQSGQGNNATQSLVFNGSIEAPTNRLNGPNQHSVVHFTASANQFLELPALLSAATSGDVFAVLAPSEGGTAQQWGWWTLGQNGTGQSAEFGFEDDFLNSTENVVNLSSFVPAAFNLYNSTESGSQWSAQVNGTQVAFSPAASIAYPPAPNPSSRIYGTAIGVAYFEPPPPLDESLPVKIQTRLVLRAPSTSAPATQPWSATSAFDPTNSSGPVQTRDITSGFIPAFFDGDMAEVILYNRSLSAQERAAVNQYLKVKYALTGISTPQPPAAPTINGYTALSASSLSLSWTGSADLLVTGYQVFQGGGLVGSFTGTTGILSDLSVGTPYSLTVVAVDSLAQMSQSSAPLVATLNPPPVVSGATEATIQEGQAFSYQVSASNGATAYGASGLPSGLTIDPASGLIAGSPAMSGTFVVNLTASNAAGSASYVLTLTVPAFQGADAVLPYGTGFEASDGFSVGDVTGQNGWAVLQGSAAISTQDLNSGLQSLQLTAGQPVSVVQQTFSDPGGEYIVFFDFYARPAAESAIDSSTIFTVDAAQFGFVQQDGEAVLEILSGNGLGSGTWMPTAFTSPLGTGSQLQSWVRLTARLDFSAQTWDLYANGYMVAASIPFPTTQSSSLSNFEIQGDATSLSYVDDIYVGVSNPLFPDVNNDGINDAWEVENGLSLATNNRNLTASPGVTVVQKYISNVSPTGFYAGKIPQFSAVTAASVTASGSTEPVDDLQMVVLRPDGTPWQGAPVTFTVTSGSRLISQIPGQGPYTITLTVAADDQGVARVYMQPLPLP